MFISGINFANKTLAQDKKIIDADPTRYNVSLGYTYYKDGKYGYGSLLVIKNALKEDAGIYECLLDD